jgi:hypothetical protein
VVSADREAVTVAAGTDNMQIGPGYLQAGCERQCPAMYAVETVTVKICRDARGAADAGDDGNLLRWKLKLRGRFGQTQEHVEVAATGTPDRFGTGLVIARL